MHFSWDGQFGKGEDCFQQCFEMSKFVSNFLGMSASNSILSLWNYLPQGKIGPASTALNESLRVAEKSGDIYARGLAYAGCGYLEYIKGSLTESEDNLLKGLRYLEKTNQIIFSAWTAGTLGQCYLEKRNLKESIYYFLKAQSILSEKNNFAPSVIKKFEVSIAKAKVLNGATDINLSELFRYYQQTPITIFKGWMAREIAEILIYTEVGHLGEAEDWIRKAIQADKKNQMIWQLARDYSLYADLFRLMSDNRNASKNLNKAIELLRECGADGWVKKSEDKLSQL